MNLPINDKYTIILQVGDEHQPFRFEALRYGETWRDLAGDKLVLSMAQRILELEEQLNKMSSNNG